MKLFKIGNLVTHDGRLGIVLDDINETYDDADEICSHPIKVYFFSNKNIHHFTSDGKLNKADCTQSLFHAPPKEGFLPREVFVREDDKNIWRKETLVAINESNKTHPYIISVGDNFYEGCAIIKELDEVEPQTEILVSMDEIAEKFNVPVNKLKIKK